MAVVRNEANVVGSQVMVAENWEMTISAVMSIMQRRHIALVGQVYLQI